MVLCIDDHHQSLNETTPNIDQRIGAGLNFLHGGGTKNNTANRWFDKTLQVNLIFYFIISTTILNVKVIVGPDGYSGLNYEHSIAEGGILTALVDYVLDYW